MTTLDLTPSAAALKDSEKNKKLWATVKRQEKEMRAEESVQLWKLENGILSTRVIV